MPKEGGAELACRQRCSVIAGGSKHGYYLLNTARSQQLARSKQLEAMLLAVRRTARIAGGTARSF